MSRQALAPVASRGNNGHSLLSRDLLELRGISIRHDDHFTRLSPASSEGATALFRLVMLPVRIAALALLWVTSSPSRLVLAAVLVVSALHVS